MSTSPIRRRCAALTTAATALAGCVVVGLGPVTAEATTKIDLLGPAGSEDFGGDALVLKNGNYVVVDAFFDQGATADVGAVYLYNGANNQLISTLTGSTAGDEIGIDGLTEVGISDFVVLSSSWQHGAGAVGAVTLVDGSTGLPGQITTGNSLVGGHDGDLANSEITALGDGNFVVASPAWDNGPVVDAGAVTFADSVTGRAGQTIAAANSLVGTVADDKVGSGVPPTILDAGSAGVTALTDDKYAVSSPNWNNGGIVDAGAVTWVNGAVTSAAVVGTGNSLVGTTVSDHVGGGGVVALTNGNYAVISPDWDNGITAPDAGAVTWANGEVSTHVGVSSLNSLVGTTDSDSVGSGGVTALTNGGYVVSSPLWDVGSTADVGAVTQAGGTGPTVDQVSVTNSLFGNIELDNVGIGGVTALTNGDYVVSSPFFSVNGIFEAGAATWVDGTIGAIGPLDQADSVVGGTTLDHVGGGGVTALTDGDYVVSSPDWDNGPLAADVGAVTWAVGNSGTPVTVTALNSIVGTTAEDPGGLTTADHVGSGGVTALTDGNYVISSPLWNGPQTGVGAATWASGAGATSAAVSTTNSLVGTRVDDNVGSAGVKALRNGPGGRYVVVSDLWDNGALETAADSGAATFSPANGIVGSINPSNSAIGTPGALIGKIRSASDRVTTDNTIVVSTAQNRLLLLRLDDVLPPVLGPMPADVNTTNAPGTGSKLVTFNTPTATDNRGVPSVVCSPASGSLFPIGVTTVTCTATDGAGLTDTGTFTVTVNDVEPPVLGHHDNINVSVAPGVTSRAVTFSLPTATDNDHVQSVVCDKVSGSQFSLGSTTVTCTATDDSGLTDTDTFTVKVTTDNTPPVTPPGTPAGGPSGSAYTALSGARLADTRPGQPTVDSLFAGQGIRSAGSTLELTVAGRGGVAADASAVALNVTAVGGAGAGYVTVFPCGSEQPTASNLNFTSGAVIPNAVIAKIGAAGKVCLFVSASTHLVVDVSGYFPAGSILRSLNPARVLDTRGGQPTFDGQQQGIGRLAGGTVSAVHITGRASIPSDASAVVLNVTVTDPQAAGFATVFPCGAAIPNASNLNYVVGGTVANLMVSRIGDNGTVCVYTSQGIDLIVDVAGFFPSGNAYTSLVPARLLDTRVKGATIDGQFLGGGPREAGEVSELKVTNRGGVPAAAGTVVLNVTVTEPTAAGYVTVYPCGVATPLASNLNFEAGTTAANAVVVKVGDDGKVCLFNSKSTQLIVDVNGYFPSG